MGWHTDLPSVMITLKLMGILLITVKPLILPYHENPIYYTICCVFFSTVNNHIFMHNQ